MWISETVSRASASRTIAGRNAPLGSISDADWQVIDAPVSRHYCEATPPMSPVVYKSVQIGPDTTVSGYYTIIDPMLPATSEDWEVLDEGYDLASAFFDTTPLVEGSYTTAPALDDRALHDTGHVVGYRLVVHVDNRECFGNIEDVMVNGLPAGRCGFLEYSALTDIARIAFHASHPANFASFHFRVVCVSTQIGVYALATNGYDRLAHLDGSRGVPSQVDLKAFAITQA